MDATKILCDLMQLEGVRCFDFRSEKGMVYVSHFLYDRHAHRKQPRERYEQLTLWQLAIRNADNKECLGTIHLERGSLEVRFSPLD